MSYLLKIGTQKTNSMILTKKIDIIVHNTKVKHYKDLGYNFIHGGSALSVLVEHLPKSSHYKVLVKCDICGYECDLKYEKYILNSNRNNGKYSCIKCRAMNSAKTKKRKYGDEKFCNKEKIKETLIQRYGQDSPMKIFSFKEKQKKRMENLGLRPKESERTEWKQYRIDVNNETYKNKKKLFSNWDGTDYYDKEYIKDNFNLFCPTDGGYPTIDHKTSLLHGFKNKIPPKEMGCIENLCITKKSNNSIKNCKTEDEFIYFLTS